MKDLVDQANKFLQGKIRKTPVEFSPQLSTLMGSPVYLKLECLQLTGSFKIRGALFYLSTLSVVEKKQGVAACSAGNHGLGVAYAAKELGVPCTIYVTQSVDQAKYDKLVELGARVVKSKFPGYDDTLEWATQEAKKINVSIVPAYDDEKIMAANGGTLATEVLEQVKEVTNFVLPMGGGGLSAGFSFVVKEKNPKSKIAVCQLADSPAFQLSLEKDKAITRMPSIETLAGGIEGGLGEKCFDVLKSRVSSVALVKENELRESVCWLLKNHQYLIEPSSAVALAGCLYGHIQTNGPTVIVLSGRNVSFSTIKLLVESH